MSSGYLIYEINKDLKELSDILNKYYDNYDIELIEDDISYMNDDFSKKTYHIKVTYTEEIGDEVEE